MFVLSRFHSVYPSQNFRKSLENQGHQHGPFPRSIERGPIEASPSDRNSTEGVPSYVAGRLADAEAIRRSRQFPYQFLATYMNASDEIPQKIKVTLH